MGYFLKAFLFVLIINSLAGFSEKNFRDEFPKRSVKTQDSKKYFTFPYSKFFFVMQI